MVKYRTYRKSNVDVEERLVLGISGTELLIILFFGFLIFGPEKLPQMGRTVGRAIRQFRNAADAANKKFKEEVADPFQDAVAPYKDTVEETTKPLQEDINAINETFNETKSMITDPFKDMFKPEAEEKKAAGAVISGGIANDIVSEVTKPTASNDDEATDAGTDGAGTADVGAGFSPPADAGTAGVGAGFSPPADAGTGAPEHAPTNTTANDADDPFADVFDDAQPGAKPIPQAHGTVKKSLAASLYDLDDAEAGE